MRTSIEIALFLGLFIWAAATLAGAPIKFVRYCGENKVDAYWLSPSVFAGCPKATPSRIRNSAN